MNPLTFVRRIAEGTLLLSFISFTASPVTSLLGIQQPSITNTVELLKFAIIAGSVMIVVALAMVFGLGYIILTGWRDYRRTPKAIRVLLAFTLGALAFSLSGALSLVVPIPFLPTILTAVALWGVLRMISNAFPLNGPAGVSIGEAVASARALVNQVTSDTEIVDVLGSKSDGRQWKVALLSTPSGKKYHVGIDAQTGGITTWESA